MTRMMAPWGALASLCLLGACATPPPPPTPAATIAARVVHYTCKGNSHVTVSYGNSTATLPGPETLLQDDAEGTHYSWPADGTHHVWALKDGIGTLSLRDGTKGTESVVQSACKPDALPK
ncbi:hypothetical protein GC209_11630 [bacterium]|nr:hypothetical protein [bacterium]